MNEAKNIIKLNELWNQADSNTITDNVEDVLSNAGYETFALKMEALMNATGSTKHAVYAWLNHGRTNVKIPFIKLCQIASVYNIEVSNLLTGGENMFETKFAVTKTVGNDETILKFFDEDSKNAALAYGTEVAKANTSGVITCIKGRFDKDNHIKNGECEVFEVWENK